MLAEHGLNVTRSFCYWPDFMPEPERLDEEVLERFADFLDAHVELGMRTIPTFIVGHMSGENWDPAVAPGARPLPRRLAGLAAGVVRRARSRGGSARIPPSSPGSSRTRCRSTAARARATRSPPGRGSIVQAVRAAGATQPISLGDGAWGVEISGNDNGYSLRALAPLVDFFGPHSYPMQDDQVRLSLTPAFACELAASFGKPVILEEFGVSSDFASEENAAAHYRQVLYTTLLAGARGWLAWNNCDYDDLRDEDPYRHHVFELHFGLTDANGQPKEQLRAMASFGEFVRELAVDGWEPVKGDAAIVVPEHFERRAAVHDPGVPAGHPRRPAAVVRRRPRGRPAGRARARARRHPGSALAVPRPVLEAAHRSRHRPPRHAGAGAERRLPLLLRRQHGEPARAVADLGSIEIFGVRHRLRHGLVDPIVDDEVEFEFVEDFGDLPSGTRLSFRVAGEPSARARICPSI